MSHALSIDSLLTASVERYPDMPALSLWGMPMSYAELDRAVNTMAAQLSGDSRVGIIAPNVPALVVALFAAWRRGAVAVPMNARLREYELRRLLVDAHVTEVISVSSYRGYSFAALASQLVPDLSTLRSWIVVDPIGDIEGQMPGPCADAPPPLDPDVGTILYTSGTTGAPKGALVAHGREIAGATAMAETLGIIPSDAAIFIVPISHAFGLTSLLSTIASGAHAVLVESTFSLEPMLEAIAANNATILHGSPALFTSLLKILHARGNMPSSGEDRSTLTRPGATLRTGFVAGSACPPHVIEGFDDLNIRVLNLFGMTEIGAATCCRPNDPPNVRYTTSGRPLPDYDIRIVPRDSSGSEGEIQVRGPHVIRGYYAQPETTAQSFQDGWFRTGDLGQMDENGYMRVSGRIKDVVHVAGLNVFPAEVEGFLLTHPDVVATAVLGTPHETMGEVLTAFVVERPGSDLTPQSVLQFARPRIAGYKLPYAIHIVPEIPLLSSGKPDRVALARSLQRDASTAIRPAPSQTEEEHSASTGTNSTI